MAAVFTPEQREELKARIVEFVHEKGRATHQQLAIELGVSLYSLRGLCKQLANKGDIYLVRCSSGLFPTEQAHKDWQNARKKLSGAKPEKTSVVDPDLIWSLPDGEIRRYDRRQNIICRECRKSEVMQRVLAFYQGKFHEVVQ